jgi:hypothetical protein
MVGWFWGNLLSGLFFSKNFFKFIDFLAFSKKSIHKTDLHISRKTQFNLL